MSAVIPGMPIPFAGGSRPIEAIALYQGVGATNQQTVTYAAHQPGDMLVAVCGSQDVDPNTISTPAGWTSMLAGGVAARSFRAVYKISDGSAGSVTFSMVGGSSVTYSTVVVFRGATGYGASMLTATNSTSAAPITVQGLPAIAPTSMAIAVGFYRSHFASDSADMTRLADPAQIAFSQPGMTSMPDQTFDVTGSGAALAGMIELIQ